MKGLQCLGAVPLGERTSTPCVFLPPHEFTAPFVSLTLADKGLPGLYVAQ